MKERRQEGQPSYVHTYLPPPFPLRPSIPPSTAPREARKKKKTLHSGIIACCVRYFPASRPDPQQRRKIYIRSSSSRLLFVHSSSFPQPLLEPLPITHSLLLHTPPTLPYLHPLPPPSLRSTSPTRLFAQFLPSLPLSLFPSPPRAYHTRLALRFLCIINDRPILPQGTTGASRHFILSLPDPRHSSHSWGTVAGARRIRLCVHLLNDDQREYERTKFTSRYLQLTEPVAIATRVDIQNKPHVKIITPTK